MIHLRTILPVLRYQRPLFISKFRHLSSSSTFYDSQSGKHVTIDDSLRVGASSASMPHVSSKQVRELLEKPAEDLSHVVLVDAFNISPSRLQTITGSLADHGCELIILAATPHELEATDVDDIRESLEEVVGVDVDGLPMKHRVGIRLYPLRIDHLDVALECGIKYFESTGTPLLDLKALLDLKQLPYENLATALPDKV